MRKVCVTMTLAAALAAGQTFAAEPPEPPLTNPTALWDSVTPESIAETVRELGGQQVQIQGTGNERFVTFVDGNIPYNLAPTVCDARPGKCVGLIMLVIMDTGTLKLSLDALNAQNKKNVYVSVSKFEESKIGIGHGMLLDSGVTKKNLAMNIVVFAGTVPETIKALSNPVVASNTPEFRPTSFGSRSTLRPVFVNPAELNGYVQLLAKPLADSRRRRSLQR